MTWGFQARRVTLKDSKDEDLVMSSRLILKTQANHPLYVIHFKPLSCFKHCNISIYGILICAAFLKKIIYGWDLQSDGVSGCFSNKRYVLNGYISSIFYCFWLNRVTRKLEPVPAAFKREVGAPWPSHQLIPGLPYRGQQPFTPLIRSINFELIWALTHLGPCLSLVQLLMMRLVVLWVFIACGQPTCHMIRHLTKGFLCKENENK